MKKHTGCKACKINPDLTCPNGYEEENMKCCRCQKPQYPHTCKHTGWVKRFEKLKKVEPDINYVGWDADEVRKFIQAEIDKAVREKRKRITKAEPTMDELIEMVKTGHPDVVKIELSLKSVNKKK